MGKLASLAGQGTALAPSVVCDWNGSVLKAESTLHQLSPFIGKVKSSIAKSLVSQFTSPGELVYDPFSGSGTVALEAWVAGRRVVASDLSPYAQLLTTAKLFPYSDLEIAMEDIGRCSSKVGKLRPSIDLRSVPRWVREFFHPETLRDVMAWTAVLKGQKHSFLLACLLGILHHQRPGFLSYPSSHTVPYLRIKKFPRSRFADLYEYRSVRDRLERKVKRALHRVPVLDLDIDRSCVSGDASRFRPSESVDAIITSPPYMRLLDYARDNRMRLWFLGTSDWKSLDKIISPREDCFWKLSRSCFSSWKHVLRPGGFCVLVLGDGYSRQYRKFLPDVMQSIAVEEVGGYQFVSRHTELIPNERRVRRGISGSSSESIIVLKRTK